MKHTPLHVLINHASEDKPPAYTQMFDESIGGLNNFDSLVLKLAYEIALAANFIFSTSKVSILIIATSAFQRLD